MDNKHIKALALISGGLDSMLAAKTIMQQNIQVEGIFFNIGFNALHINNTGDIKDATWVTKQLGIKLHKINAIESFKPVLIDPKYGYGANVNPCLDCKIFMVKHALKWMEEHDFDFLITGEVIGQRLKSQRKQTMPIIMQESGANDRLLRPLCAKNLAITLPEKQGWVNRELLYGFSGRSRSPQIALAKTFGFSDFPQPAGGCLLTEPKYANRLKDLWDHKEKKDYTETDIMLLKAGRHLRPKSHFKLIIARNEADWDLIEPYAHQFVTLMPTSHEGPITLIDGAPSEADIELAAKITARFSAGREAESVTIQVTGLDRKQQAVSVEPLQPHEILEDWYL